MQKGFIQIPVLIAIIVGLLVLGGGGYFGVKQYQEKQELELLVQEQQQKIESEGKKLVEEEKKAKEAELQTFMEGQQNALKDAQSEIEKLKKQTESQKTTPTPVKETASYNSTKSGILSNVEIISKVKPATVYIETTEGVGSGMILDTEGYILTNAHVVWDVSSAQVKLSDGRSFSAEVVGRDEVVDLAILKITGVSFPKVVLGNSDNVVQGDDVFTLGYPFGLEGDVSFKEGTISRRISDGDATYLETSAEIHPGNSGGPLVNRYGDVIGINSASYGNAVNGVNVGETIKLAIPVNIAKTLIPQLKAGKNIVIDHTQYEKQPSEGVNTATDFMIKAQCTQLGLQKKTEEDSKNSYGGTVAYGYSVELNTCVYGRSYLLIVNSIDSMCFSGQIWDLLTGEQIYRTDPIMTKSDVSGVEADEFLAKQEEATVELWAVYNALTQ